MRELSERSGSSTPLRKCANLLSLFLEEEEEEEEILFRKKS
jgi:hypothetical protein